METKKILICDDHILFCNGIAEILKNSGMNYEVTATYNSESCKKTLSEHSFDVFICDLNIDEKDGFVLLEELKEELKNTFKIILSAYYEDFLIEKAEKMGINAFLKKETTSDELISVIELDKKAPFYSQKKPRVKNNSFLEQDNAFNNKLKLSKQEKEIIKQLIQGKSNLEIADKLFISETTVKTHRRNIYRKLEINTITELILFSNKNNL